MVTYLRIKKQKAEPDTLVQLAIACERLVQSAVELPNQMGRYISGDDWKAFQEAFTKIKNTSIG